MDAATAGPIAIAVIGGSGLYRLFTDAQAHRIRTPYGVAEVTVGELGGRRVAFLTRHGVDHSAAPHLIPYRAHIWALGSLGVRAVVSSSAVGGLHPDYAPGTLVLTDQLIDRTWGRADTFYDAGSVQHLPAADPFDPELHAIAARALTAAGETFRSRGTAVVIQGPRFSTRAESRWFAAAGGHIVNMTMSPEVVLASEVGIGTVNVSFVTDMDAGVAAGDADAASHALVLDRLAAAQPRIVAAISAIVAAIPSDYAGAALLPAGAVAEVLGRTPR